MNENKSVKSMELVLDKHIYFIENYGKKHEKYVNNILNEYLCT